METPYKVAGIDVHKSTLAVVIADVAQEGGLPVPASEVYNGSQRIRATGGVAPAGGGFSTVRGSSRPRKGRRRRRPQVRSPALNANVPN
jgi:hypothetical protein